MISPLSLRLRWERSSVSLACIKRKESSLTCSRLYFTVSFLCSVGEEDFGELSIEDGLDEDKVVSEEDAARAQKLKGEANAAFSSKSGHATFLRVC